MSNSRFRPFYAGSAQWPSYVGTVAIDPLAYPPPGMDWESPWGFSTSWCCPYCASVVDIESLQCPNCGAPNKERVHYE